MSKVIIQAFLVIPFGFYFFSIFYGNGFRFSGEYWVLWCFLFFLLAIAQISLSYLIVKGDAKKRLGWISGVFVGFCVCVLLLIVSRLININVLN